MIVPAPLRLKPLRPTCANAWHANTLEKSGKTYGMNLKDLIQDLDKGTSRTTKMEMAQKAEAPKNQRVQTTHSTLCIDLITLAQKNGRGGLTNQSLIIQKMMKV